MTIHALADGDLDTFRQLPCLRDAKAEPHNTDGAEDGDVDLGKLNAALAVIPADDRADWVRCGLVCYRELGEDGFAVWVAWSRKSQKFDAADAERVWASFRSEPPANRPTVATIYYLADQADREWRSRYDAQHRANPFGSLDAGLIRSWLAIAEDPPVRWIVADCIPACGLVVIGGEPAAGKSVFVLDTALRCAHGMQVLGQRTKPASTLYFAAEGMGGYGPRIRAWRAANPTATPVDGRYVAIADGCPDLGGANAVAQVGALIDEAAATFGSKPDILVVDTLAMAIPGADENDAGAIGKALRVLAEVRRLHGCAIIVVHHTRKPSAERRGSRSQHELRGSSAIPGAADVVLLVTVDGAVRRLTTGKIRDGKSLPAVGYTIHGQPTGAVIDGELERGPVVRFVQTTTASESDAAAQQDAADAEDVERLVAALRKLGVASSRTSVIQHARMQKLRGLAAFDAAVSRGLIRNTGSTSRPSFELACARTPHPRGTGNRPGSEFLGGSGEPAGTGNQVSILGGLDS